MNIKMIDMEVAKALANEIVDYISERGHQKEEKFLKETKPKKNKKGEVTNGAIIFRLLSIIKTLGENKEEIKKIESAKKPKWQTPLGFQQNKYNQLLSLLNDEVDNQLHDLKNDYQDFLLK